jgi:hypothetical protein
MMRSWLVRLYAFDPARFFFLLRSRLDFAGHDAAHQGIDFFLGKYFIHGVRRTTIVNSY